MSLMIRALLFVLCLHHITQLLGGEAQTLVMVAVEDHQVLLLYATVLHSL
jgi:hypothetical protein